MVPTETYDGRLDDSAIYALAMKAAVLSILSLVLLSTGCAIPDDENQVIECSRDNITCDGVAIPADDVVGCGTQNEIDNGELSAAVRDSLFAQGCSEIGGSITCRATGELCRTE